MRFGQSTVDSSSVQAGLIGSGRVVSLACFSTQRVRVGSSRDEGIPPLGMTPHNTRVWFGFVCYLAQYRAVFVMGLAGSREGRPIGSNCSRGEMNLVKPTETPTSGLIDAVSRNDGCHRTLLTVVGEGTSTGRQPNRLTDRPTISANAMVATRAENGRGACSLSGLTT